MPAADVTGTNSEAVTLLYMSQAWCATPPERRAAPHAYMQVNFFFRHKQNNNVAKLVMVHGEKNMLLGRHKGKDTKVGTKDVVLDKTRFTFLHVVYVSCLLSTLVFQAVSS